jgi:hypothetical protein
MGQHEQTEREHHHTGCLICGNPIVYNAGSSPQTCAVCGQSHESNAVCEENHYVCDRCHALGSAAFYQLLLDSPERDPVKLFLQVVQFRAVHMHGPEHHSIVPSVLLAAYRNNSGDIQLDAAMDAARQRGEKVPGGVCGFWGVCGAAAGAGIYASIITGSNPLNAEMWSIPQQLTARCLNAMAEVGGPRCCKRTSRIAIETAVQFTKERFHISMPTGTELCAHYSENRECLRQRCPYYGGEAAQPQSI